MRGGVWGVVAVLIVFAAAGPAGAQVVAPVTDGFDDPATGFELPGWATDPPSTGGVGWAVDATPATVGAGGPASTYPPGAPSAGSLNFNDGTDYEDVGPPPTAVKGYATTPVIDISGLGGSVQISFRMAYELEPDAYFWGVDLMIVQIHDDTGAIVGTIDIGEPGSGADIEVPLSSWSSISIDASVVLAGSPTCQIDFVFTSVDESLNDYAGWFIDDFQVSCVDTLAPTAPSNVSPADGAIVSSPVALDWTDATDTSPCGTGTVAIYILQVDNDPAFGSINYTSAPGASFDTVPGLAAGTWYWRVAAVDTGGNSSPWSAPTSFVVEPSLAPLAAGTLHVNEPWLGAQSGLAGFVDPIRNETPVFSAVYLDPNTVDSAAGCRYQVSDDPTFTTVVYDSGASTFSVPVAKDARCPDLPCGVNLGRDTVYYWRIQFTDLGGLTGPFSAAQSFRIGDDFEFGVRPGSSNHSRRCFVATASFGGVTPPVASLMTFRSAVLERNAAGRSFSRSYAAFGPALADAAAARPRGSAVVRRLLTPVAAAAATPALSGALLAALAVALLALGLRRL